MTETKERWPTWLVKAIVGSVLGGMVALAVDRRLNRLGIGFS
jgi:hypothetical protein